MRKWKIYVFGAAAVLLVAALISAFTASTVIAQTARAVLIKDMDNPIRQPIFLTGQLTAANGLLFTYTVPDGKRFVGEFINGHISGSHDVEPQETRFRILLTPVTGIPKTIWLFTEPEARYYNTETTRTYVLSQLIRFYADPGTEIEVRAFRFSMIGTTDPEDSEVQLVGHLVDTTY